MVTEKSGSQKVGSQSAQAQDRIWPLIIIGLGPAGYNASLYASRYKIPHLIIGAAVGGQISKAHIVENYLGFISIKGPELGMKFREHALHFAALSGAKEIIGLVESITMQKAANAGGSGSANIFQVKMVDGTVYRSHAIILGIGTKERELGLEREHELIGRGVSYCATCDGFFFKDKVVGVVGGGDTANTASLYLADIAKHVHQFVRSKLRGEAIWHDKIRKNPKITLHLGVNITKLLGKDKLTGVQLDNGQIVELDGLFIEIGSQPDLTIVRDLPLETDNRGYIKVDATQATNIPGFYAAGDITTASNYFRQLITSAAEGAIAANSVQEYLTKLGVSGVSA